jgi:hypothetical protein
LQKTTAQFLEAKLPTSARAARAVQRETAEAPRLVSVAKFYVGDQSAELLRERGTPPAGGRGPASGPAGLNGRAGLKGGQSERDEIGLSNSEKGLGYE